MRHVHRGIMLLVLTGAVSGCFARTPAIRPDPGHPGSEAVASLEKVRLGG